MNKEVKELAKALFLKRYKSDEYLHEKNKPAVIGVIQDCIAVAELFNEICEEKK